MTSGSLWSYYRDEVNDSTNENNANCYRINNNKPLTSKSFKFKTKIIVSTPNDNNMLDTDVFVPLKYLSNSWRSLDLTLINCEIELDFKWEKYCVISEIYKTTEVPANPNANPPNPLIQATKTASITFQINNANI